jgi:hypothetical protein
LQVSPFAVSHFVPQLPQFCGSFAVSTQTPLQLVWPPEHATVSSPQPLAARTRTAATAPTSNPDPIPFLISMLLPVK